MLFIACLSSIGFGADAPKFKLGPDSQRQENVPRGKVIEHEWKSTVFEGTTRKYWIYFASQYDGSAAANVMVFEV